MPILAALLPSWLSPALLKALGIAAAIVGAFVLAAAYRASLIDLGEARANAAVTAATAAAQIKAAQDGAAAVAADAEDQIAQARLAATVTTEIANAPLPEPVVITVTVPGAAPKPPVMVCRAPAAIVDAFSLLAPAGSGSGVAKAPAGTSGVRPGTHAP